jgi:intracellular sulfur oxidation DsrE/DsrF family protein
MKKWILILILVVSLFAEEGVKKVVFDFTDGKIETIEKKVLSGIAFNKTHYENKLEKLDIAVVIHGDAYKFFINDLKNSPYKNDAVLIKAHDQLGKRLSAMATNYEVEFIMCESGMKSKKIDPKSLYNFVKLTPSSTIGLIDKQQEGYAYIPVH